MNTLKLLEKKVRGWFPTEPTLTTHSALDGYRFPKFVRWMAIAVVAGTIAGALLGVVGSFLGLTSGVGVYVWPIITAVIIGIAIGLFSVYMQKSELPVRSK
jgi:hypothetical protein